MAGSSMQGVTIPTEPIGSIPRPLMLLEGVSAQDSDGPALAPLYEAAIRDTIERFEATGFSLFGDDPPTSREVAFAKIRARAAGSQLAAGILGGGR